MLDIVLVFKTLVILALAIMSPGPDFFMVLRNSLAHGRKAGLFSALGIATGCFISFTILISGLEFLFDYKFMQIALSVICGLYLIYLGIMSIKSKPHHRQMQYKHTKDSPMHIYFKNGLLTNILNPKLYTVSGAILAYTQQQNPNIMTNIAIITGNALIALIWFSCTVFLFTLPGAQTIYFKKEIFINRILGCILILVGCRIIFMYLKW